MIIMIWLCNRVQKYISLTLNLQLRKRKHKEKRPLYFLKKTPFIFHMILLFMLHKSSGKCETLCDQFACHIIVCFVDHIKGNWWWDLVFLWTNSITDWISESEWDPHAVSNLLTHVKNYISVSIFTNCCVSWRQVCVITVSRLMMMMRWHQAEAMQVTIACTRNRTRAFCCGS